MIGVALAYSLTYLAGLALSTRCSGAGPAGSTGPGRAPLVRLLVAAVPAGLLGWVVAWAVDRGSATGSAGRWPRWAPAVSCCW